MSVIGWGGLSAEGGPLRSATNCGTDEVGKYAAGFFFGHFEKNSRPKKLKDLEKLKGFFQKLKFLPTPKF